MKVEDTEVGDSLGMDIQLHLLSSHQDCVQDVAQHSCGEQEAGEFGSKAGRYEGGAPHLVSRGGWAGYIFQTETRSRHQMLVP